jgi:hypothetical protein
MHVPGFEIGERELAGMLRRFLPSSGSLPTCRQLCFILTGGEGSTDLNAFPSRNFSNHQIFTESGINGFTCVLTRVHHV